MVKRIDKGDRKDSRDSLSFHPYLHKTKLGYIVKFAKSCIYETTSAQLQEQINKLFGLAYLPYHHINSYRFGWRINYLADKIEIFAYIYENGKRIEDSICLVDVNKDHLFEISIIDNRVYFHVENLDNNIYRTHVHNIESSIVKNCKVGYELGLYFGGKEPCPQYMQIEMVKTKDNGI